MSKVIVGIAIIMVSLVIMYVGYKYMRVSKATTDKAGIKVDFKKTPATGGFAPGITGAVIMLTGLFGCIWGFFLTISVNAFAGF